MKKIVSLLAALSLLATSSVTAISADRQARCPDVFVDEKIVEFPDQGAYITDEGRTLVPARGVFEAMDCKVSWDADSYSVTVSNEPLKKEILLAIDGTDMRVVTDGTEEFKTLDVPAQLMNDRTMIPLRAVSEALGCDVSWNENEYRVDITSVKLEEKKPLDAKIYLKAPTTQVKVGNEIQIPVIVSDAKGLKGAMFKVDWDPKMLKIIDLDSKTNKGFPGYINQPELFAEFCDVNSSDIENGTITIAGGAAKVIEKESKDYSLGMLRFKVLSGASGKTVTVELDTTDLKTNGNDGESNVAFSSAEGISIQVKKETSSGGGGGGGGGGSSKPSSGNKPSSGSGSGSSGNESSGDSGSGSGSESEPDSGSGSGSGETQEPEAPEDPTPDEPEVHAAIFTTNAVSAAPGEEITIDLMYDTQELVNIIAMGAITFSDENVEIVGFEFSDEAKGMIHQGLSVYEETRKSVVVLFKERVMFSGILGTFTIRIPESASGEITISAVTSSQNEGVGTIGTGLDLGSITVE